MGWWRGAAGTGADAGEAGWGDGGAGPGGRLGPGASHWDPLSWGAVHNTGRNGLKHVCQANIPTPVCARDGLVARFDISNSHGRLHGSYRRFSM